MRTAVVVTDSNVDRLYGDRFVRSLEGEYSRVERIVFPAGEKSKTLETYAELVRGFAALGLTRNDVAYALGGGVVGDLTGFAAATYMRGIGFVQVPTTLLAMVDSSIGGKTGVDIPEGKNLVGAFHLPKEIIRDVGFLETLPEREMKNGLAEMIKTAVLFDPKMFGELMEMSSECGRPRTSAPATVGGDLRAPRFERLVDCCAQWKQKIVDEDFKEGGKRKLLNLGHTFGHAIEAASEFRLGHGECVAIGMRIVGKDVPEIGEILDLYGFPRLEYGPRSFFITSGEDAASPLGCGARSCSVTSGEDAASPLELDREKVMSLLTNDKKRSGDTITLVIPRKIGECELVETPMTEVGKWLR